MHKHCQCVPHLDSSFDHILHAPAVPQHLTGHLSVPECRVGTTLLYIAQMRCYAAMLHYVLCTAIVLCATSIPCTTTALFTMHQNVGLVDLTEMRKTDCLERQDLS